MQLFLGPYLDSLAGKLDAAALTKLLLGQEDMRFSISAAYYLGAITEARAVPALAAALCHSCMRLTGCF